jgi:hypothetical protein
MTTERLKTAITAAIGYLEDQYIQKSKHRMGSMASRDLDTAVDILKNSIETPHKDRGENG